MCIYIFTLGHTLLCSLATPSLVLWDVPDGAGNHPVLVPGSGIETMAFTCKS